MAPEKHLIYLFICNATAPVKGREINNFGRKIYSFKEVGSTNDVAKELAKKGAGEGTLVVSKVQSRGQGRFGRPWISKEGGLWFSLILKPRIKKDLISILPLLAAVAVARAISSLTSLKVDLKWPNDVLINEKKVAGILSESLFGAGETSVILGIGINVNQRKEDFPEELREKATSLFEEIEREIDLEELLKEVTGELEKAYLSFLEEGPSFVIKEWKKMDICLGRAIKIVTSKEGFKAKALDIDERGALIIGLDSGRTKTILSGEVRLE
ncbi:biotin--[acetyl-CoA-carboxylase] ligase, partial [bacterium]|nr:biotin--[acetyl-CoA-carboxylase] ligase [bacterium]MBU1614032.1 biotin--[acetyl-CoA-carboxylase] ligase [bacterium]